MTVNIGLMGGTFDPIHLGHLAVAEESHSQLKLTEIIFVPAGHPYFKTSAHISSAEHRVNMLNLAIAEKPYFKVSLIEVKRPGPSYAVDTVSEIRSQLDAGDGIFFIMGWDSLLTLPFWQEPERLIQLCQIVVAPRPGYVEPDIDRLEKDLPGIARNTVNLHNPLMDISATEIRQRVRSGLSIEDTVPVPVAKYIHERGLYLSRHPDS